MVETQRDVLIAIVLTPAGITSIRIGATSDKSIESCYELLARLTPQIRSLDAAVRLGNFQTQASQNDSGQVPNSVGEIGIAVADRRENVNESARTNG